MNKLLLFSVCLVVLIFICREEKLQDKIDEYEAEIKDIKDNKGFYKDASFADKKEAISELRQLIHDKEQAISELRQAILANKQDLRELRQMQLQQGGGKCILFIKSNIIF